MSFFKTSDGKDAASDDGKFEMGGGGFTPIPKDTSVLALCEEAKTATYEGDNYVNLKWRVQAPEDFKGRVLFQKIRCWDNDVAKRDKAIRMLAAIDKNAGGKLAASGEEPSDKNLGSALMGKPMVLSLGVWEMNGNDGNWVLAVAPYTGKKPEAAAAAAKPASDFDEDIPF